MKDVGYSGQYLDNKEFRIKVRTGADIHNVTGDAICGEMFLVTGANPAFYVATETSTDSTQGIYNVMDLVEQVLPASNIKDIQVGIGSVHVLTHGGDVWSAGDNYWGQLGDNTGTDSSTFVKANISNVDEISIIDQTIFYLKDDGTLWGSGRNSNHQIRLGLTSGQVLDPTYTLVQGVSKVSAGSTHVIYTKTSDGKLYGQGSNGNRQLGGTGDMGDSLIYDGVVSYIHASNVGSFFVDTSGNLSGIGWPNTGNVFGNGTAVTAHQGYASLYSNIASSVSKVASTTFNTLILKTNGQLWGCGENNYGELGLNNQTQQASPVFISSDVSDVFASNQATYFITTNGELKGMGANYKQELGGTVWPILTPKSIDSSVSRGTARNGSIIYQKNNNVLYAGGHNAIGQLGLGSFVDPIDPKQILTLPFL
jgi:alpha-tubulin suppressor-like RCC1 family protein